MSALLETAFSDSQFQWNERLARHLLNRAGFGVPRSRVAELAARKPDDVVAEFVDYEKIPQTLAEPDFFPSRANYEALKRAEKSLSREDRRRLRKDLDGDEKEALGALQLWWLDKMCRTPRPLEEKLALFWHGHFATSNEKVRIASASYDITQVFRRNASGNFQKLVLEVGKSPAMLHYLDQARSRASHPNENWARELMELFTLGIGNYKEKDIKELARAFTGWMMRGEQFEYVPRQHDPGVKSFLGKTGNFDGDQAVEIVVNNPACAPFICRKLWTYFAYEDPEQEIVDGLAETFRKSGLELKPVLRQMFSSRAFYSDRALSSQIKSPAQFVVQLHDQLDVPLTGKPAVAQLAMRAMGQNLFSPPNVKGWPGGRIWINTDTLLIRCNFANYLVAGLIPQFGKGKGIQKGAAAQLAAFAARLSKTKGDRKRRRAGMEAGGDTMEEMTDEQEMSGGKDSAAEDMEMVEKHGPAGQDSMPADVPSKTLYSALERKSKAKTKTERPTNIPAELAARIAPFHARDFFTKYEGKNACEIIDDLSLYFIGWTFEEDQRRRLVAALTRSGLPVDKPISTLQIPEGDLRATMQLLLSTAEYQVC